MEATGSMGNLTTAQLDAIKQGEPIKQKFWMRVPLVPDHSVYYDVLFDEGIHKYHSLTMVQDRVLKAGKRRHVVWNPSPNSQVSARAIRWRFEVDNHDDYFNNGTGGIFYYGGSYRSEPQECYAVHKLYVWEPVAEAWSEITHMAFVGKVLTIEYEDTARPDKVGNMEADVVPEALAETAVITCEQTGVWDVLKRVFSKDDADSEIVDDPAGLGKYDFIYA